MNRIPSLDGARTISIALVIVSHLGFLATVPIIWRFDYGNLGVRVFFVISGFLITSTLLAEREKTGVVKLGHFFGRRFLRLVPAYWAYIGVIALLIPTGLLAAKWHDILPALAYYADYRKPIGVLGHVWSLSVEEQFYLIWPTLIVLFGLKRAYRSCIALLMIAPVFRILAHIGLWGTPEKFAFECVSDALATGCLLAIFRHRLWEFTPYRRLVSSRAVLLIPAAALLLLAMRPPEVIEAVAAIPLLNIGIAALLDRYTRFPLAFVGKALNQRTMVWLGTLSYSIYLWQQLWVMTSLPIPIKLAAILACATASYELIEKPFLGLRSRWRAAPAPVAALA